MILTLKNINRQNNILLIGIGETNKYLMDIVRPESVAEVKEVFGNCDLVKSYELLANMGATDIYVMNIEKKHDYLNASIFLQPYDFTYIVPIDIFLSDTFYDPMKNGKKTYYLQYMLEQFYERNESVIIATDKHASLYETIDDFLSAMNKVNNDFKSAKIMNCKYENIIFVANNITAINNSNAYLAGMLETSSIDCYPAYANTASTSVVFNIDRADVSTEMAYFKKHMDNSITVENLLNLDIDISPIKIVFIFRILKYIFRDMDFSDFFGEFYSEYQQKQIEKKAEYYMSSYLGYILTDYSIDDIYAVESTTHPGTVDVYLKYTVQPIGCTEQYVVVKKISE